MKNYQLNKRQYLYNLYSHMQERVTNPEKSIEGRKYLGLPICPRAAFIEFGLSSKRFDTLFKRYKRSKGQRKIAPSIDRIQNTKGYTLGNMQFLTVGENSKKDRRKKSIVIKNLSTKKVHRFYNTREVGKFLNHRTRVKLNRASFINTQTGERFTNLTPTA